MLRDQADGHKRDINLAADEIGNHRRLPLVANRGELDTCHLLEQFHRQMNRRAGADVGIGTRARFGDDGLDPHRGEPVGDDAPDDIHNAAFLCSYGIVCQY